jgi:hypothetical protein
MRPILSCIVVLVVLLDTTAQAQTPVIVRDSAARNTATLSGRVLGNPSGAPIVGAEVSLLDIDVTTRSGQDGTFKITSIPAGTHILEVRIVGYRPVRTTIRFGGHSIVSRDFFLQPVTTLEAVNVSAEAMIPSFEDHRAIGLGQFLTRQELAKQGNRKLGDVMRQMRGVRVMQGNGGYAWIASGRGAFSLGGSVTTPDAVSVRRGAKSACYSQVFVDRHRVYGGNRTRSEELFDVGSISVTDIEAVEWYAGPSSIPMMYTGLNANCGVLVIHTRRFRADTARE